MLNRDLYADVTTRIIKQLEDGVTPWQKPWTTAAPTIPHNAITKRAYSGINTLLLWLTAQERGYPAGGWMTFRQAQQIKASIQKGEKGTHVVYVNHVEEEEDGKPVKRTIMKSYTVFHEAQIDNLPSVYHVEPPNWTQDESHKEATSFLLKSGVKTQFGSYRAAYLPHMDVIEMPNPSAFSGDAHFISTWAHETCHSTGHASRLNRTFGKRFGDKGYAAEELTAELGAAFIAARFGYDCIHDNAAYIGGWLELMKADDRAIFTAASHASQAVDYLKKLAYPDAEPVKPAPFEIQDAVPF